jgi:hypothetical protein
MPVRVSCPFCNTPFDLPAVPPSGRTVCPRCGESVPVSSSAETTDAPASVVVPGSTASPANSGVPLAAISLGLTALVAVAAGVWWFTRPPAPGPTTAATKPDRPAATVPPLAVPVLKYLPRDSQIVVAVQPQQVVQYAARTGRPADQLFGQLGLPKSLLDKLSAAGFPPESLDHIAVGANVTDLASLGVTFVVSVRTPIDEDRLRRDLKATVNPDKRDHWKADLGGVPVHVTRDDRTLLFAWKEADLGGAKAPSAGFADLRPGVKESVEKLSVSSFAWIATDSTDWAKVKGVEAIAGLSGQKDLPKRLDGVRAAVVGLSFEPTVTLSVRVRLADAGKAKELAAAMGERFREAKGEAKATGEWAEATIPFDPPGDALATLRKALEK